MHKFLLTAIAAITILSITIKSEVTQLQITIAQIEREAEQWLHDSVIHLDPHHSQLLANLLYFSFVESKLHYTLSHLLKTTTLIHRNVKNNVNSPHIASEYMHNLIEHISIAKNYLDFYKTLHTTWMECSNYINKIQNDALSNAIETFQFSAQKNICAFAQDASLKTNEYIVHVQNSFSSTNELLKHALLFYNGFVEKNVHFADSTEENKELLLLDNAARIATSVHESFLKTTDIMEKLFNQIETIELVTQHIFLVYYKTIYTHIKENRGTDYLIHLFNEHGFIHENQTTLLQDPSDLK